MTFSLQLSRKAKLILAAIVILPILTFAVYTWSALRYAYSAGNRAGYVQKFSRKGWICKTWEGELILLPVPMTSPEKFTFSVRNDSIAAVINQTMGKKVMLTYAQHKGIPTSCFGETEYFITGVREIE